MIVPALDGTLDETISRAELTTLARDTGAARCRTCRSCMQLHATGVRVRRNHGYLFAVTLVAWLLKLELEPHATNAVEVLFERAAVAIVPGPVVVGFVARSAPLRC